MLFEILFHGLAICECDLSESEKENGHEQDSDFKLLQSYSQHLAASFKYLRSKRSLDLLDAWRKEVAYSDRLNQMKARFTNVVESMRFRGAFDVWMQRWFFSTRCSEFKKLCWIRKASVVLHAWAKLSQRLRNAKLILGGFEFEKNIVVCRSDCCPCSQLARPRPFFGSG